MRLRASWTVRGPVSLALCELDARLSLRLIRLRSDIGTGKTVEADLILSELLACGRARRY
jgi:hypothetical protein